MDYKIGSVVRGKVTGIQPYGAFVSLDNETQGLIHISECKHGFVKKLTEVLEVGQELNVVVLDVDEFTNKISLSLRALEESPHYHYRNKKRKHRYSKQTKIGFKSLEQMMPKWIKEAKENEKKRAI